MDSDVRGSRSFDDDLDMTVLRETEVAKFAAELGLAVYCPIELPPCTSEQPEQDTSDRSAWIRRSDIMEFAERAGYPKTAKVVYRVFNTLLRHDDESLQFRSEFKTRSLAGDESRVTGEVEFASLAAVIAPLERMRANGTLTDAAIHRALGEKAGIKTVEFLIAFVLDRASRFTAGSIGRTALTAMRRPIQTS